MLPCYCLQTKFNVFTSVCLSMEVCDVTSCLVAWSHVPARGVFAYWAGRVGTPPVLTSATKAGGTHPTEMHSCVVNVFIRISD